MMRVREWFIAQQPVGYLVLGDGEAAGHRHAVGTDHDDIRSIKPVTADPYLIGVLNIHSLAHGACSRHVQTPKETLHVRIKQAASHLLSSWPLFPFVSPALLHEARPTGHATAYSLNLQNVHTFLSSYINTQGSGSQGCLMAYRYFPCTDR